MAKKEAPVAQKMYLFIRWLVRRVNHFPRSQRFVLGDRLENTALDIQRLLVEAVFSHQQERQRGFPVREDPSAGKARRRSPGLRGPSRNREEHYGALPTYSQHVHLGRGAAGRRSSRLE